MINVNRKLNIYVCVKMKPLKEYKRRQSDGDLHTLKCVIVLHELYLFSI